MHSMYSIYNIDTQRRLNSDMELHFLEVPKFTKKPVKEMTRMERWLAYFSNKLDEKEMEELAMKETAIHTALDATSIFMQNEDERLAYLNREMAIMDYESDKAAWTEEGESRLARLISLLLKSGKAEEAAAASESEQLRKELYKKYGIA